VELRLCHHEYPHQKRRGKGLLRAYIEHMTDSARRSPRYGLRHYEKIRPTAVQIGKRRKPVPNAQTGFLRISALKRVAASLSDTEAARRMQQAKNNIFEQIRRSA